MAKGLEKIEKGAMKTVMGIPKTAKHPTKTVKHPTKKGEKAMSGTSLGWFAGEKRIWDRPGGAAVEGLPDMLDDMALPYIMI